MRCSAAAPARMSRSASAGRCSSGKDASSTRRSSTSPTSTPKKAAVPTGLQLILYKYEIAGVVYECSQDVTMLRHLVDIYNCRLGFPASVRYDPHNPTNSLIVAETWSGLRETANSVAVRQPAGGSRSGERSATGPPAMSW